jgi:hypothetical protein
LFFSKDCSTNAAFASAQNGNMSVCSVQLAEF